MPSKSETSLEPTHSEPSDFDSSVLIFGCGYLGQIYGRLATQTGGQVYATTRVTSRRRRLEEQGFQPVVADWTDRRSLKRLPKVGRVLVAVSYDSDCGMSRYDSQVGGFRNLLSVIDDNVNVCYISTTGVYHQTDGRWVDERSPTRPTRVGGKVHLEAESMLHRFRPNSAWTILRLAGIYGPDRVPRIASVVEGRPIASDKDGFLNLIHVHDAARAVHSTWENAKRRVYAVCDDQPMRRAEFYREIARQTHAPNPTFVPPSAESSRSQRSESNKRIWNRRLKNDLLNKLDYPTYREGLAQILAFESRI
ncbi:NAD-dependent epimerase/dehydratase family protein [Novipirellula aureliae]|uniref:NAD-dependent epimerase/dehydratase family protein n=1 Tax=Novipirellula aureliae TaxID=2527966 RepID=UPI0011B7F957|nr:NAD-dependent epimerase/dehydratase family protein [Novipirellula aureliae]